MARALENLGHHVHTLVLDDGSCSWNEQFYGLLNGSIQRFRMEPLPQKRCVERLFRDIRPDIVIHHYSDLGIDLSLNARGNSNGPDWKDVYLCHSDDPDHYNRVEKRKACLAHVICVSEICRDHIVRELGVQPEITSLMRYFFVPPKQTADAARAKYLAVPDQGPMNILYAGRLESYQKRAEDLVPFAEALWKLGVPFQLHIAGSGSLEPMLRDRLSSMAFGEAVVFHGYLAPEALFNLMADAAIYVSFSEFEGLSTSLVQAMHHGLIPLITPTKSGCDFLEEGNEALFFDIGDTDAAARRVKELFEVPSRRREMVESVVRKVERECSPDTFIHQISSFIERLVPAVP